MFPRREYCIINAGGSIGAELVAFCKVECFRGADKSDRPYRDEVVLIRCVGVILADYIRDKAQIVYDEFVARTSVAVCGKLYALRLLLCGELLREQVFSVKVQTEEQKIFQRESEQHTIHYQYLQK